jgi:DNA modification methylase
LPALKIRYLRTGALKPNPGNPRIHSGKQIRQIADSIRTFGWTNPILVDAAGRIVAGHGRWQAAKLLGRESVPVIRLDDMTAAQRRAYLLADNKLAENATWDSALLAAEFNSLFALDLDFDVTITGFEMGEIDAVVRDDGAVDRDEADDVPDIDDSPPISTRGDLWRLGDHRLLCGDATHTGSFKWLMDGRLAQAVITDPPYNLRIAGNVSGLGSARHSEFPMASGEMTQAQFTDFLATVFRSLAAHSADGSLHYAFMDWRHLSEVLAAGEAAYDSLENLCVWAKANGGMGSLYRSAHELVFVFKKGKRAHVNNVQLGRFGRNRTNVWRYDGMNSFGPERDELLALHPTVKPLRLVEDAILDCTKRNGIVLDPFVGSGTTLIAAARAGRRGYGIEIDPKYADVTLRRFRKATQIEPVHAKTGRTFKDIEDEQVQSSRCPPSRSRTRK